MSEERSAEALRGDILALIDRLADGSRDDPALDALLSRIAEHQIARIAPLARLAARADRSGPAPWPPAVPTDVFRFARLAAHDPSEDARVFLTSGTTSGERGRHALRDLSLYDRAAEAAARHALFFDVERIRLVVLAPHPDEAPESSLSYMLGRFEEWFGRDTCWVWRDGRLSLDALVRSLDEAAGAGEAVALLGTAFAFVHAEDGLADRRFALPPRSRVMQTGGTKGRSREIAPEALRAAIAARYGVSESAVVAEYGMTELSSQMYETTLRAPDLPRRLWVPGWVRASVVHPESLAPMPEGEPGLLRLDDAANLDSVAFVQTSDVAVARGPGRIELLGRAAGATPRGCSLAVEEALAEGDGR